MIIKYYTIQRIGEYNYLLYVVLVLVLAFICLMSRGIYRRTKKARVFLFILWIIGVVTVVASTLLMRIGVYCYTVNGDLFGEAYFLPHPGLIFILNLLLLLFFRFLFLDYGGLRKNLKIDNLVVFMVLIFSFFIGQILRVYILSLFADRACSMIYEYWKSKGKDLNLNTDMLNETIILEVYLALFLLLLALSIYVAIRRAKALVKMHYLYVRSRMPIA